MYLYMLRYAARHRCSRLGLLQGIRSLYVLRLLCLADANLFHSQCFVEYLERSLHTSTVQKKG